MNGMSKKERAAWLAEDADDLLQLVSLATLLGDVVTYSRAKNKDAQTIRLITRLRDFLNEKRVP